MEEGPKLIEGNVFANLQETLKQCHEHRVQYYSRAFNLVILVGFVVIVFLALYYSYRKKPTQYEKEKKMYMDQQAVLSKIRYYQDQQKNILTSPITNL
jgi:predicted histidine transporter YuiF (NhaC family)